MEDAHRFSVILALFIAITPGDADEDLFVSRQLSDSCPSGLIAGPTTVHQMAASMSLTSGSVVRAAKHSRVSRAQSCVLLLASSKSAMAISWCGS